jgi:trigger factor
MSTKSPRRPARRGDFVLMDLHTTLHTAEIEALSGADQLYEVGSGVVVPELDQELDGRRAGEIVKFNATVPQALGGEHAGKEVTFQALVKEVREKKLPALDDEFAKTASEFETLDELKADLAARIEKVKELQAEVEVRNRVLEQALDDTEFEPPDSLVRQEMAYRLERLEGQLRAGGISIGQYLQQSGVTEEQVEADLRRQAERNVRAQLLLDEIARREELTASADEVGSEVAHHAEALRVDPADLGKQLSERGRLGPLAGDIIRRKALNWLVDRAEVREEDAPSEATGGA